MSEVFIRHKPVRDAFLIVFFTVLLAPPLVAIFVEMADYVIRIFVPRTNTLFQFNLFSRLTLAIEFSYILGGVPALLTSLFASFYAWKYKVLKLKNVMVISVATITIFIAVIFILNGGFIDRIYFA